MIVEFMKLDIMLIISHLCDLMRNISYLIHNQPCLYYYIAINRSLLCVGMHMNLASLT